MNPARKDMINPLIMGCLLKNPIFLLEESFVELFSIFSAIFELTILLLFPMLILITNPLIFLQIASYSTAWTSLILYLKFTIEFDHNV